MSCASSSASSAGAAASAPAGVPLLPFRGRRGDRGVGPGRHNRSDVNHQMWDPAFPTALRDRVGRDRGGPPDPGDHQHRRVRPRGRARGHAVRVAFEQVEDVWLPLFEPSGGAPTSSRTSARTWTADPSVRWRDREVRGRRGGDRYRHVAPRPEADGRSGRAQCGGDSAGRAGRRTGAGGRRRSLDLSRRVGRRRVLRRGSDRRGVRARACGPRGTTARPRLRAPRVRSSRRCWRCPRAWPATSSASARCGSRRTPQLREARGGTPGRAAPRLRVRGAPRPVRRAGREHRRHGSLAALRPVRHHARDPRLGRAQRPGQCRPQSHGGVPRPPHHGGLPRVPADQLTPRAARLRSPL